MAQTLDFKYSNCKNTIYDGSVRGNTGAGSRIYEYLDPYVPTKVIDGNGCGIYLNGVNPNIKIPYAANPIYGVDLILRAPYDELTPALSGPGTGNLFGLGYKWRFRFKNSITGEASGLSPLPSVGYNVGIEAMAGSADWLGQTAYFYIPNSVIPAFADTVQLFRNTTQEDSVFYLVQTVSVTGSTLAFVDNFVDADITFNEQADLQVNPTYNEGVIPPCVKAHKHGTRRLWLYGLKRMGPLRVGALNVVAGEQTVTFVSSNGAITPAREGQLLRLLGTNAGGGSFPVDSSVYRIIEVIDYITFRVYPPIIANNLIVPGTAYNTVYYEIIDDRDARTVYQSQPGTPHQYDLTEILSIGFDSDEQLHHITQFRGYTWALTNKRIYQILDDNSEDPSASYRVVVAAEEGTVGFDSTCTTPFGIVFVNAKGHVRLFSGAGELSYQGPSNNVTSLGSDNPYDRFLLKNQFSNPGTAFTEAGYLSTYLGYEPSLLETVIIYWDDKTALLYVSYAPYGMMSHSEAIVFSGLYLNWRGPWRVRCSAFGYLRNDSNEDIGVIGDDFGNLSIDNAGSVDVLNGPLVTATTVSSAPTYFVTANTGDLDHYSDRRVCGVPISIGGAYTQSMNTVIDVIDSTTIVLEKLESGGSGSDTTTIKLGSKFWYLKTAFLDSSEPIQPKELQAVRMRLSDTYSSSADYFLFTVEADADGTVRSEEDPTTPLTLVWYEATYNTDGVAFQLKFQGVTYTQYPSFTQIIADVNVRAGRPAVS